MSITWDPAYYYTKKIDRLNTHQWEEINSTKMKCKNCGVYCYSGDHGFLINTTAYYGFTLMTCHEIILQNVLI